MIARTATLALGMGLLGCRSVAEAAPSAPTRSAAPGAAPPSSALAASSPAASLPPAPAAAPPPWPLHPAPGVATDWCVEGLDALDEETCYVVPAEPSRTVLVYLHGIVPPGKTNRQKTEFEHVVENASRRVGVVALIPRGARGLAGEGKKDWWGWPVAAAAYDADALAFVRRFEDAERRLAELVGTRFEKRYVAGSSAGAYFTVALAWHADIRADGFAALSGGAPPRRPRQPGLPRQPFYVGYGLYDVIGDDVHALAAVLREQGWPVKLSGHPFAHGAKEVYLDEAFAFFREAGG